MKQHILNRVLPMSLRRALRQAALRTIPSMRHLDMRLRLLQLSRNGFEPKVIYDVGASTGEWARMAASIWPKAAIFGFEPNAADQPALEQTHRELRNFSFRRCFLGPEQKLIQFHSAGVATSVLDPANQSTAEEEAPMLTIDGLVAEGQLPPPELLKIDVQGFELDVLGGAKRVLATCQAVLLEVSFYRFFSGFPLADEVIRFMKESGYVCYDILGCLRRPSDDALAQMDLLFVREEHPLRATRPWQ